MHTDIEIFQYATTTNKHIIQTTKQGHTVLTGITNHVELTKYLKNISWKRKEYTAFSTVHRTFSKTDQTLGHKTNLNRSKKIEIKSPFPSDNQGF